MKEKYYIIIDDKTIQINKLGNGYIEIELHYQYLEYKGYSNINIKNMSEYLEYCKTKCLPELEEDREDCSYILRLPILFINDYNEIILELQENILLLQKQLIQLSNKLNEKDEYIKELKQFIKY
jgi:hypothetical protein